MKFKKILYILFIFLQISTISFADNYLEKSDENLDYYISVNSNISDIPLVNARHAIVLDRASKTTLYGKNEKEICKMASTTKIMTAIIVIENCSNLNEQVIVSKKSSRNWWIKTRIIHKRYRHS